MKMAEELAASQREISIAEFFEKNKHMLGFDSGARGLVTAVKEAVDNALDAAEEAGVLPDIYVEIEESGSYYRVVVEDNGPGLTKESLPKVFGKLLYGSRFHAREQSLTPDQQLLVRRDGNVEFVPIGRLCDAYLPEEGDGTVRVPDDIEVPSFGRETHDMSWQPVTHAIRHETKEQTYEITTEKGRTVEVTGNHSVFSVTEEGETKEVKASDLGPGDTLLTPRRLPSFEGQVSSVNLLEHLTLDQLDERRVYVYGFEEETLAELRNGETVRKRPSNDSNRERTYYRYEGVDILRDSLEQNYIEKGYLPAETVIQLGWEEKAADCEFKTYRVGGEETTVPVTLPVTDEFVELLAYYVSEGHAGPRQIGFTFGSHETELIGATEQAVNGITGSSTTVARERNSTRVKAFGSPLAMFLKSVCSDSAETKQIPEFVFALEPAYQEKFIAALYQGDGSDTHPSNELSHTTTSKTLARQLSILWNMQGVLASTEVVENADGYADTPAPVYRTKVYGEDVNLSDVFSETHPTGTQQYKRIPVSLLDDVRVGPVDAHTVPDTIPGLLMGAGVGSGVEHAEVYQSLIEDALAGKFVEKPRYAHNLRKMGLLDGHQPTDALKDLWKVVQNLQGLTDSDMCLLPVKSVEETDPPKYVYDVSVPGASGQDENFVVANEGALSVKNSRGQQGIGISAAVLYSQLTSGKPARITSKTKGDDVAQYFELIIDTDTNEPEISVEDTVTWEPPHGTRIEIEMEANMRARQQLHDYIKHTAVVNPHARIELKEPKAHFKFERATDQLPAETEEIRPHPHGVELGTLIKMLSATDSYSVSGFLQSEFTRVGQKTADSVVANFRDRHYGREVAWRPPQAHEEADIADAVRDAISNKSAVATDAFAEYVVEGVEFVYEDEDRGLTRSPRDDESPQQLDGVGSYDRIAHHELEHVVNVVAGVIEDEHDTRFGETVREKAVEAAWKAVTAERTSDLYQLIDGATTSQKDDAVVQGLAERIAAKFGDDPRDRITRARLRDYVERAADMTVERDEASVGETARENITAAIWEAARRVPDDVPLVREVADDRDTASELLEAMRETDILAPPTDCLAPITEELVLAGLEKEYDADFFAAATRDAEVHGGDPFIIEAGIAYGGDLPTDGTGEVLRFANRVPLVYQRGACATTDVVKQINWRNYGLDQPGGSGIPNGPVVLMVHVASTNVPFTSESKDAVANVPAIEDEIELALREAGRELKSYLNKRRSLQKRREKQDVLATILPEMAEKLAEVTGREPLQIEDSVARIMNNVLVDREVEDGTVRLVVENNGDTSEQLDVTEIVSTEPTHVSDGATVVEMDGEWFIKWSASVSGGDETALEYSIDDDATFDLSVDGVETERLTINA